MYPSNWEGGLIAEARQATTQAGPGDRGLRLGATVVRSVGCPRLRLRCGCEKAIAQVGAVWGLMKSTPGRTRPVDRTVASWLRFCSLIRVVHYVSEEGRDYFDAWFRRLSHEARARVQTRIDRVELGNFGDHRSVGRGVSELRIDSGPGYRLYFGRDGEALVILLGGGVKKGQAGDIAAAHVRWRTYKQEKRNARESS